jgi:hypothetical protein
VIDQSGVPPPAASASIAGKMIKVQDIKKIQNITGKDPQSISLSDLQQAFRGSPSDASDPPVSRLLFLADGKFRYLMHESVLHAFLVNNPNGHTLQDLLNDPESARQISRLVALVSSSATLAQAKAALDAIKGAQDIIVTSSGDTNGQVLGWLSNTDLIKAMS